MQVELANTVDALSNLEYENNVLKEVMATMNPDTKHGTACSEWQ